MRVVDSLSNVHLVGAAFDELVSIKCLGFVVCHHSAGLGKKDLDKIMQELVACIMQPSFESSTSLGDTRIFNDVKRRRCLSPSEARALEELQRAARE